MYIYIYNEVSSWGEECKLFFLIFFVTSQNLQLKSKSAYLKIFFNGFDKILNIRCSLRDRSPFICKTGLSVPVLDSTMILNFL